MHARLATIGILSMLLLGGCAPEREASVSFEEAFLQNPLMAENIGDQMLDFVTELQIRASESKQPITDPKVLRTIDDTFIRARAMVKRAHEEQDAGKKGAFRGLGHFFVKGEALLYRESLFFGYEFVVDAAPGLRVLLAAHVGPATSAELRSDATIDLGPLQNIIGPQEYRVGQLSEDAWNRYRTVVLFSPPLDRVIGYAQIRKRVLQEGE